MGNYSAEVVCDTVGKHNGIRLTTLKLRYPRFIHSEFMTHRMFSRNASSSRAIPVKKVLSQVWNDPAIPEKFANNIPGMQAGEELSGWRLFLANKLWRLSGKIACVFAWGMMKVGLHKQWANRVLEPWQFISVVVTATEWDNYFELRIHPDAQPEIYELSKLMKNALDLSVPVKDEFHLPFVTEKEKSIYDPEELMKMSTARCARVSYLTHEGTEPSFEKDIILYNKLVGSKPIHASPTEHSATNTKSKKFNKNFRGWIQHRVDVEESL